MTNNEYGKVFKRAWGDRDFKTLTATEQLLYVKLISQSDISLAGVLTLAPVRWATQTAGMDVEDVSRDLAGLARRNYVLIDAETQEVLVRSYVRNDLGWKSPRTMIGIANAIGRILSPRLRVAIARELGRLDTDALSSTINEKTGRSTREVVESIIGDVLADTPSNTLPDTPSDGVSDTPSDTPSDGVSAVRTLNDNCNNSGSDSDSDKNKNNRCSPVADAPHEPIHLDPDKPAPQSTPNPILDAEFETFYSQYPRKIAPAKARQAYRAARKKATLNDILAGLDTYKRTKPAYADWAHPSTWLNGERWLDAADEPPADPWEAFRGYDPDAPTQVHP